MKISFALFVSAVAILLTGCESDRPLMTDEAYDARHPAAPHTSDPSNVHQPQRYDPTTRRSY